ncbi:TniQ family protein [Streptomyces sp. NPDC002738]
MKRDQRPVRPPAVGALRVRPLPYESTASYLNRLASSYQLGARQLLEGIGITVRGQPDRMPGAGEIALSPAGLQHLAAFTGIPHQHLPQDGLLLHKTHADPGTAQLATARWHSLEHARQPTRTCPQCTLRHTHGNTSQAWAFHPEYQRLCPRHHQWSTPRQDHQILNTDALPELTAAHRAHQRLQRRPNAFVAYVWASVITTGWYDHQQHLTRRWHTRLTHLARTNPPPMGGRSWALTGRDAVTYPETVALARRLAHAQLPHSPDRGTRQQTNQAFLNQIAHHLGLDHLTPAPGDRLWNWMHAHTYKRPGLG